VSHLSKALIRIAAIVGFAAAAFPAHALIIPFGGAVTGTDPLGHKWVAENSPEASWGEPGLTKITNPATQHQALQVFNPNHISNHAGPFANEFDFIWLLGETGQIDKSHHSSRPSYDTQFVDVTKGVTWIAQYVSNKEIHFLAPAGSRIDPGDLFFVNIAFTKPVDTKKFSFAALWSDIPEPATLGLLGGGLLGLAAVRRRRQQTA